MNITRLPKVELHCHLDGIISPQMAHDIQQQYPQFPLSAEAMQPFYPIYDLDSFWNWWTAIEPIEADLINFHPIIEHYIAQLKQQTVRYFELMIAFGDLDHDLGKAVAQMQAFREWVNQLEGGLIQVEFLIALGRSRPLEQWPTIEKHILKLHREGLIVGVALAGPEIGNPVEPFQPHFAAFKDAGLGIEIHAGEWVGAESVWDALDHGYPDRLGHGVSLFDDEWLIDYMQEHQLHIEMCPISNLKTGGVKRIEDHPIIKAKELGLNFSVNTDDPGPFESSMNLEFELLVEHFNFTEADFQKIYKNSLASRFQQQLRINGL